ncbi:(2Fe-2S)-binding protein [Aldersonia sp. NBC_00410]|uniref:(2Fe-2S)-binding protein n=1 Tax=Aldersonia sp. NBC_00410 TaxID=2975954 RepID=UPI002254F3D2|nr:(2Fe-2S)-binding protein [Aldersonia sp. NBC_00410]MCX5045330.1 (2Fe-2S)-binding protein [Aldersonia sp. NBC_00410]
MTTAPTAVGGVYLTQPDTLSSLIHELGAQWRLPDPRVAGTLWWYMACDVLLGGPVRAIARAEAIPDPSLDRAVVTLRPDAGVAAVRYLGTCASPEHAQQALHETLEQVIEPLAAVSGAAPAALRAVVTDAIGNLALTAARDQDGAVAVARALIEGIGDLPRSRFVDVTGRRFVHRVSCCMVDRMSGADMCISCPRRDGAERAELLARMAAE